MRRMSQVFPTVRTVIAGAGRVAARFPFVVLVAVTGTGASVVSIEARGPMLMNVIMASALGLPLMFGLRLLRERWESSPLRGKLLEVAGIILLAGYALSIPPDLNGKPAEIYLRFLVLNIGLHFAVAFVPCLTGAGEREFWQFNRRLFQRFALSALYTTVLSVGLALAMASSSKLFSLDIDGRRYGELWMVMTGIFNTLFFLGGVPGDWEELREDEGYPRGLRAFAQFALAPLVIVFVGILYLYAIKIIVAWKWPHGWVALPVSCFAVVGILAALLLQPARTMEGERWARWYWKWFFRALGPLSVLLLLSLQERVSEYGVTESRYLGFIVGGWLLLVSIYFTVRPGGSTRSIPASLALLCFLSVAGPWGAFSISSASQKRHLLSILQSFGAVENGRLVPAKRELPLKDQASARSILTHLIGTYGSASLQGLLAGYEASPAGSKRREPADDNIYVNVESVVAYLNGNKDNAAARNPNPALTRYVSVDLELAGGLPVDGYRSLYHECVCPGRPAQKLGDLTLEFPAGDNPPRVTFAGTRLDVASVEALLASIAAEGAKGRHRLPPAEMSAKLVSGSREWLLVVEKFQARAGKTGRPATSELDIYLLEK